MKKMHYVGIYNNKHLFYSNNATHLSFFTTTSEELLFQYPLSISITIKAHVYLLNKIYFFAQTEEGKSIAAFVIDLSLKQGFDIVLTENDQKEMSKHLNDSTSFVYEETMLMFIGGINQHNKISSTILSFDISLYTLTKQKYQEFSFYPRYRHGSTSYNQIIYVIGGFTKIPESDDAIADDVQFIKYKNNGLTKFSTAKIEGDKPILMIDPILLIVNEKYLVSFSAYKYPKVWVMDTSTIQGKNYTFKNEPMTDLISCHFDTDLNKDMKSITYSSISDDKSIQIKTIELK